MGTTLLFCIIATDNIRADGFKPPRFTEIEQNLIETLKIAPMSERVKAIEICGINGYIPCYYTLISLLKDEEPIIRKKSTISLGLIRNLNAIPYIEKAMEIEKDESVQIDLIRSLVLFQNIESTKIAEKYLSNDSEKVRFASAKVLCSIVNESLYDKIMERMKSESSDSVKVMLLHAALKIKQTSGNITELVRYFYSTNRIVRLYAAKAAADLKIKESLLSLRKAVILEDDMEVREEFHRAYNATYLK